MENAQGNSLHYSLGKVFNRGSSVLMGLWGATISQIHEMQLPEGDGQEQKKKQQSDKELFLRVSYFKARQLIVWLNNTESEETEELNLVLS